MAHRSIRRFESRDPTQEAALAFSESHGYERAARVETEYGPVVLNRRDLDERF